MEKNHFESDRTKGYDTKKKALAKRAPKYHHDLTRMYGEGKIPDEARERAANGKGRFSAAYRKYIDKGK